MTTTIASPPALAALASRLGLDLSDWQVRGRLELRVDAHPRISLRRAQGERVELEARLAPLPSQTHDREALVDRLMLRATAHAAGRASALVLAPDGEHLMLQLALDGGDRAGFEEGLAAYLDDLDYWRAVLGERA